MRFGRYELIERIGTGGMAEVYLAMQRGPRGVAKRLVIKRIAAPRVHDPQRVALFEQEARIGCDLSHSNLVSVFDFGRVADHWFIAMEHVDGCDLGLALDVARERGERMPAALVAHVAAEVCRGLAHMHARGYIHRDVTPRNVLVSWDGLVKLSDYGLAIPRAGDRDLAVRGTRRFMSPEQAAGEVIDGRADLYSVGAILVHADARDARLAAIAAIATSSDPAARYPCAEAMRAALAPIAVGIDDRGLGAWLGASRPRAASGPRASDRPVRAGRGATPLRPDPDMPAATSTTIDGPARGPRTPLDALLASAAARPRRRVAVRGAAVAALAAAAALVLGYRWASSAGAVAPLRGGPVQCLYGDGYYCGAILRPWSSAPAGTFTDDALYHCSNGWAHVQEVCPLGCEIKPPGEPDVCQQRPPGLARPADAPGRAPPAVGAAPPEHPM